MFRIPLSLHSRQLFRKFSHTSVRPMPICMIDTDVSADKLPKNFTSNFTHLIAKTLNKPKESITISLRNGTISKGGDTTRSTCVVRIWSIGVFDAERNPAYSKLFIDFISHELGLSADRIVLGMHPLEKWEAGHVIYTSQ